ncbi:unnamed protein product [Lepeophtheirus salmonis]|uniref:(salmon louse) hypothetical protein n=1 Tax=Lepeophtheirus salmonis TaxID=72036 RepID=A0A817FG83_LEPSM|nr:unnamed protein product [Lepeophtheirus salmonis]CAG9478511.1 unnamed protein product [Lepeophtheirus salmonis]
MARWNHYQDLEDLLKLAMKQEDWNEQATLLTQPAAKPEAETVSRAFQTTISSSKPTSDLKCEVKPLSIGSEHPEESVEDGHGQDVWLQTHSEIAFLKRGIDDRLEKDFILHTRPLLRYALILA